MPVFKSVNKDFFKKWTPQMAYITGFFAADGYITLNKRGANFWCIQITDKDLLYKIRECVGSEHKISEKIGKGKIKNSYKLQIGSIEMCNDLRKLGFCERKTKNLSISYVPKKYLHDFVRGYFDGDGNVWSGLLNKKRKTPTSVLFVCFTSASVVFLGGLLLWLKNTKIEGGSLTKSKHGNYGRLRLSTLDALKLYEIMYNRPHKLFLARKKLVFEKFIKLRS